MAAYADADDLEVFFDSQLLADLVSDTGDPDPGWKTNSKLTTILQSASGRVESACTVAEIYTIENLSELTGNSLALLKEITCSVAVALLIARRGGKYTEEYKERLESAEEYLERLRRGERVFGVDANRSAGSPDIEGVSLATFTKLNLISDRTKHYFPARAGRLPRSTIGE